jgi:hypothetical protein
MREMIELNLRFEFSEDTDAKQIAQLLQTRLKDLPEVENAEAVAEQPRFTGLEVAAVVGVTVLVLRGGREIVAELRKLLREITGLAEDVIKDTKKLKKVLVETEDGEVSIDEVKDKQLKQLKKR